VGLASLENIIAERGKKPFADLFNFCKRIDLRTSNKRVIENLIYAGAFDLLPGNRAQKLAELGTIIEQAITQKKEEATGQMGLFAAPKNKQPGQENLYSYAPLADMQDKEKLEKEKEVVGFYLTSHPLEAYTEQRSWINIQTFESILQLLKTYNKTDEPVVTVCGLITSKKEIMTKKGDRMAFVQLEDMHGSAEIVVFPRTFKTAQEWLNQYHVFVVRGSVDLMSPNKCKIKANEMVPIELLLQEWHNMRALILETPSTLTESNLEELKAVLPKGSIPLDLIFIENGKKMRLRAKQNVKVTPEMADTTKKLGIPIKIEL